MSSTAALDLHYYSDGLFAHRPEGRRAGSIARPTSLLTTPLAVMPVPCDCGRTVARVRERPAPADLCRDDLWGCVDTLAILCPGFNAHIDDPARSQVSALAGTQAGITDTLPEIAMLFDAPAERRVVPATGHAVFVTRPPPQREPVRTLSRPACEPRDTRPPMFVRPTGFRQVFRLSSKKTH